MQNGIVRSILKKCLSTGLVFALAASAIPDFPAFAQEKEGAACQEKPILERAGSISVSEDTLTYDEPFAKGTAGCDYFRIPALITLQNGSLLATADARWETTGDGGGIDSIASVSEDGGKTWHYSFPLYFPDSYGYAGTKATTIIDPGVLEGPDGTIYFIADVNPTGGTTMGGYRKPGVGTGYINVDNGQDKGRYQAITADWDTSCNVEPKDDDLSSYPYYIGDLNEDGFAEILNRADGSPTGFGVDEWYNLYSCREGVFADDLDRSTVVNNDKMKIQQNAFYKDSSYHVFGNTDYLWVITSKDGGKTWEHPRDLTDQIKRNEENAVDNNGRKLPEDRALLVSPGQGISTSAGDLIIGFYDNGAGDEENASIVYSTDNGETWERTNDMQRSEDDGFWTSENEIVELEDGTLRMFARNGRGKICYGDAKKDPETGKYEMEDTSVVTDVGSTSTCNVTAISYSKKINGKQAILVGCPTGGARAKGRIFTFLVDPEDNSMELYSEFAVPDAEGGYVYSCLTEMEDGTVALLWEPNKWSEGISILFDKFSILDLAPKATLEGASIKVRLEKGGTYTRAYDGDSDFIVAEKAKETVAAVTTESGEGSKQITITGVGAGYTKTVIDGMIYEIYVKDSVLFLPMDGEPFVIEDVAGDPGEASGDAVKVTYEEFGVWKLFKHVSGQENSLSSFAQKSDAGSDFSDAEFTFTGSGTTFSIYNEATKTYLKNKSIDAFFESGEESMMVTPADGGFRICNLQGARYVIFYSKQMNFNANSKYEANYEDGSYELKLLEKQDTVSDDDDLPGYKAVSSITSGKKYLIAYSYNEDNIIVLYPKNGTSNQTKLARKTGKVTIAPQNVGEASIVVDGTTYRFQITRSDCNHASQIVRGEIKKDCMEDGYTGDAYCKECGLLLERGSVVPAFGSHAWGEAKCLKKVTETENGLLEYTCQNDKDHKKTEIVYAYVYQPFQEEYEYASEVMKNLIFYKGEAADALPELIEECKKIIKSNGANPSSILKMTAALQETVAALTPLEDNEIIDLLDDLVKDVQKDYDAPHAGVSAEVWKAFEDGYKWAQSVTSDTDIVEVKLGIKYLAEAARALTEEKYNVASKNLKSEVAAVQAIIATEESKYTPESWKKFYDAYQAAANASKDATEAELAALLTNLQTARKGLKLKETGQEQPVQAGESIVIDGVTYVVTDVTAKKAAVLGANKTSIKIPGSVSIKNETFAVTEISEKAFSGSRKLKKVVIGDQVTTIGKQAFYNCKNLSSVTIGAKVTTIGKQAFSRSSKLKTIVLKCKTFKKVDKTAFKKTASKGVKVQMPKGLSKSKRKKLLKKLQNAGLSKKAKMK